VAPKTGYQSHFVITNRLGFIPGSYAEADLTDEFVLTQPNQILPAYYVELNPDITGALLSTL
jgi:hypothetical protein